MPGWGTVVKYPEDEQTRSGGSGRSRGSRADKGKDLVKVETIKIQCIELVYHLQDLPRQEVQDRQEVLAWDILANSL